MVYVKLINAEEKLSMQSILLINQDLSIITFTSGVRTR